VPRRVHPEFEIPHPAGTAEGEASGEVDLTFYFLFERIRAAIAVLCGGGI